MKKNLLPILVAVVTAAVVGGITVYRNSCNVVDPETLVVSPCLRTADYITYSVLALVIGGVLFFWLKKRPVRDMIACRGPSVASACGAP